MIDIAKKYLDFLYRKVYDVFRIEDNTMTNTTATVQNATATVRNLEPIVARIEAINAELADLEMYGYRESEEAIDLRDERTSIARAFETNDLFEDTYLDDEAQKLVATAWIVIGEYA